MYVSLGWDLSQGSIPAFIGMECHAKDWGNVQNMHDLIRSKYLHNSGLNWKEYIHSIKILKSIKFFSCLNFSKLYQRPQD